MADDGFIYDSRNTKSTITISLGAYSTIADNARHCSIHGRISLSVGDSVVFIESTTLNKISDSDSGSRRSKSSTSSGSNNSSNNKSGGRVRETSKKA